MTQSPTTHTPAYIDQIKIHYHIVDISPETQKDIKEWIHDFLSGRMSSYLTRDLSHPDAELLLDVHIAKTKDGLYDGKVVYTISGHAPIVYQTSTPFTELYDVVSHAFDRFKQASIKS